MLVHTLQGLGRAVAYFPGLNEITGGITASLFLQQLMYWTEHTSDPDGWIYKTRADLTAELGMTRREQETARRNLKARGLIEEVKRGMPQRLNYRICLEAIDAAWAELQEARKSAESPSGAESAHHGGTAPASGSESAQQEGLNPPDSEGGKRPTALKSLSTKTEITHQSTQRGAAPLFDEEIITLLADQEWIKDPPAEVRRKVERMVDLNPDIMDGITLAEVDLFVEYHSARPASKRPVAWNASLRNWLKRTVSDDRRQTTDDRSRRDGRAAPGGSPSWYRDARPAGVHQLPTDVVDASPDDARRLRSLYGEAGAGDESAAAWADLS